MKKLIALLIGVSLIVLIVFGAFKAKRWLEIDACLDSGGSWNYETNRCEYDAASNTQQTAKPSE
jgi:hypothetical protein